MPTEPAIAIANLSYRLPDGPSPASTSPFLDKLSYMLNPSLPKFVGKPLLENISMTVASNSMVALMGPSGAGKSTLLDVISCRKTEGSIYGSIAVDGIELTQGNARQRAGKAEWVNTQSAYVQQDDCHIPQLTVRETLTYAARLRLSGASHDDSDVAARVDEILQTLGIDHVADSPVGDSLIRGISGGQLKRLSIATETITKPDIIFLDEPTSGLDSAIALEVMTSVKALVDAGRTVVCTIHQPSAETFALFTDLLLLSAGKVVYAGPTAKAVPYFESLGYLYDGTSNPADFIIEVSGGKECPGNHGDLEKSFGSSHVKTPSQLASLFADSSLAHDTQTLLLSMPPPSLLPPTLQPTSFVRSFTTLLSRSALANARNTAYIRAQIAKNIIVGALAGCIFFGQGKLAESVFDVNSNLPTAAGYNVVSILYFALLYAITGNLQAIPQICAAKVLFLRERSAGAYTTFPFFCSNALVYLPLIIFTHVFFTNLTYWLVQLPISWTIISYLFVATLLVNIISFYFSQLLAFLCSSSQVALALFPIVFMFLSNFAGFTIQLNNINSGWVWAPYISFPRWAYEGLVYVTFTEVQPDNYKDLLSFYQFDDWEGIKSIYILVPYMLGVNLLVLWAMQPARSAIRIFTSKADDPRMGGSRQNSRASSTGGAMEDMVGGVSSVGARPTTFTTTSKSFIDESAVIVEVEDEELSDDENRATIASDLRSPLIERNMPVGNPADRRGSWSVEDFRRNSSGVSLMTQRGLNVAFDDLHYSVTAKDNKQAGEGGVLPILRGAHGRAQAGEMVALMGASGAGKSTLLDVLAGRKTLAKGAKLTGVLKFNGSERERKIMRRSAYVTQDNVHLESITVKQTLEFAAALRMENATLGAREERVLDVAKMLGLDGILESQVGGQMIRGISGGQLKRLSIAVEIISLPELIFLDEPTTGLDSAIAHEVMSAVRNLANNNRTVICTIHQPTPATFALFDKLLLLAMGRTCYFGDVKDAPEYFVKMGYTWDSRKNGANPAEFVVAVAGGFEAPALGARELCERFLEGDMHKSFESNFDAMVAQDLRVERSMPEMASTTYPTGMLSQLRTLAKRQLIKTAQNKKPLIAGLMRHVVVALFYGGIYNSLSSTQLLERLSLCFFTIMFVVMGHQQSIPIIFEERLLFYRERGAKIYGNLAYWATGGVSIVPVTIFNVAVFVGLLYKMTGFKDDWESFGYFYLIVVLSSLCGLFFCQLLAVLSPSQQSAITLFPAMLFFFISFAGFIIQLPSLPPWLSEVPNVSFIRWGFQGLAINEFKDNSYIFPDSPGFSTDDKYKKFADLYGFTEYSKWTSVPILLINMAVLRALTFLGLRYVRYENR